MKLILFLHLPKTAGTSLSKAFRESYEPFFIRGIGDANRKDIVNAIVSLADKNTKNLPMCFFSHMHYGLHRMLPESINCEYITIMREPIERTISNFVHFQTEEKHPLYPKASKMTIEEFLNDKSYEVHLRDVMTRYLSGNQSPWLTPKSLEDAKNNLQEFNFVGHVDDLDADFKTMKKLGIVKPDVELHKLGVHKKPKPAISQKVHEKLEEINYYDLRLYSEYCKQ